MPTASPLAREIRHLIGAGTRDDLPDAALLERFVTNRDEAAFEVLIRRYGRLVFAVCRRVLADPHAAEDAFQATFLVLVHKAGQLDRGRPVGDWLYAVAFRLARRARQNAARRREKETAAAQNRPSETTPADDLAYAVHEELNHLPDRHRLPLVLSYLEGRNYQQIAREIGCPVGTVGYRLAQARDALRDRLVGRGVACPAAGFAALLAACVAPAAVPAPLAHATARAALWFAGPTVGPAVASAGAVELARGAIGATTTKLKVTAAVLMVGLFGGGTAWVARSSATDDAPKPVARTPEARKPEAALPDGATARMGTSQFRHGESVFYIAYTPDAEQMLTAGKDRTIRLWDAASGREVRRFERVGEKKPAPDLNPMPRPMGANARMMMRMAGPTDEFAAALSGDGRWVAANKGKILYVWDAATGKLIHELDLPAAATDVMFTPGGKVLVAVGGDQSVTVFDPAAGKELRRFAPKAPAADGEGVLITGSVVSPDGKYLACQQLDPGTANGTVTVFEFAAGKQVSEIALPAGGAQNLTFSPDGAVLAWTSYADGIVLWDVAAGKELRKFGRGGHGPRFFGTSFGFSADGKTVAVTMSDNAIEVWDTATGKQVRKIGGHAAERVGAVRVVVSTRGGSQRRDLAFAPDGKTVAASLGGASVRQFDVGTGNEVAATPGHPSAVVAVGSDGRTVTTVSKETVCSWDAGKLVKTWQLPAPAVAAAVSPDGKRLATAPGGGKVTVWDPATGGKFHEIETDRADVAGLAFSADGTRLATKSALNSAVNLWDTATGKHVRTLGRDGESGFTGRITIDRTGVQAPDVAFSADGRLVAAAGDKKQLCVWDAGTGALLREFPGGTAAVVGFALSANGQAVATVSDRGAVTVAEVATGGARCEFKPAGDATGTAGADITGGAMSFSALTRGTSAGGGVGFTPDGRFVFAAAGGPAVRVWDILTGQEAARLTGHQGSVTQVKLAPDARHLVSGSVDTTAVTWDLGQVVRVEMATDAPPAAADLDALWADLAKPDTAAAFAATRKLLTDRGSAVTLIADRVKPVPAVDDERVRQLVADLGSGKFDVRRKATAELERLGELAFPHLRKAVEGQPPLELKQRVERLLEKPVAQAPERDRLRERRAVEVLELAGTPEAKKALAELAKGAAAARLTADAKAAAARIR